MPSPLGEGQADTPINHLHLGEVKPTRRKIVTIWERSIPSESVFHYEFKFSRIHARTSPGVPILIPALSATFGSSRKCFRLCVAR